MAGGDRPLGNSPDAIRLHPDALWRNNKPDEPNLFCVELASREFEMEPCGLEPLENLPDMHRVLFACLQVDNNIVEIGNTEQD